MSIISGSKKITNKIDPFCFWFRVFTDPLKPITEFLRLAIPAFNSNFVWETHTEKIHNTFHISHFPYLPPSAARDFGIFEN